MTQKILLVEYPKCIGIMISLFPNKISSNRRFLLFTWYWFSWTDTGQEKPSLDWNRRMCIALGAARGLLYLHEQCNPKIIHRDVKAANILLDENFESVVGDFGLAKLLDRRDSHVTTAVRGTVGHIAPEYLSTGQSSEKTDVFGFGILLLELITGQKALDAGNGQVQKGMILDWVSGFPMLYSILTIFPLALLCGYHILPFFFVRGE